MDSLVASILEPCNVFIGMSGLCVKSAEAAKRKYGAKVFIERGSRHILSQKEILDAIRAPAGRKTTVPDYAVRRELASYEIADIIVVPSRHAKRSFIERGVTLEKLFRNPYGVDLSMFPPTPAPSPDPPTVIYVGSWSLRKGCDVLTEAWQKLKGVKLIHVGPYGDEPIPRESGFQHYGPVDQERLADFYAKAHVFAIASREEGLSLVQAQALACGLPVVCTDRTGGEDLSEFLDDPSSITVVSIEDSDSLANAIHESLDRACRMNGVRDLLGQAREKLSWRAYGERYDRALQMCNQPVR
jgi:glycosyltransferase involved in cell wall biosynthesis